MSCKQMELLTNSKGQETNAAVQEVQQEILSSMLFTHVCVFICNQLVSLFNLLFRFQMLLIMYI